MRALLVLERVLFACLILPALALTALRLTQPSLTVLVQLVALTPCAVLLYALASVLVLVRLARGVSPRACLLFLTGVAAMLGLHAWWFAPQVTGTPPTPQRNAEVTTVMTANLFVGATDAAELLRVVTAEDVDLLVVVEVTPDALRRLEQADVQDSFGYRAGEPARGPGGTMVFSEAPISRSRALATEFGSWEVRLASGLTVVATHPQAPTSTSGWRADHRAVLRAVVAGRPDLVVGDLNATADHRPLQDLSALGYRDAAEISNRGWQPTWPAGHLGPGWLALLPPLARLDHVLVGTTMTAHDSDTVRLSDTDHLAVVARVVRSTR